MGALVRHTGSGLACGNDMFLCAGSLLPSAGPGHLHMTHRVLAYIVMAAIIWATIPPLKAAKAQGRKLARVFGIATHALVLLQIVLGMLTVHTLVQAHVATTHLAIGALLLLCLWAFFLLLGPLGTPFIREKS